MPKLVIHPLTDRDISQLIAKPSHAVLIIGPTGSGKSSAARLIASQLLGKEDNALESYPYISWIRPIDGKAISIESIRQLQQFMTLKIPGHNSGIRRIAIIEEGHLLTTEAQNALLKTLEEPPEQTMVVLTAASAESLLPTIISRVRNLQISIPAEKDLADHFSTLGHSSKDIARAIMLSGGLPGLTHALLTDPTGHPLYQATEEARTLLQASSYERLTYVDVLSKQKQLCGDVLFILGQMAHMALQKSATMPEKNKSRWQNILKQTYISQDRIRRNSQPKLVLTELMLNL
jgi:DNA polymerase-3 subunit delta'